MRRGIEQAHIQELWMFVLDAIETWYEEMNLDFPDAFLSWGVLELGLQCC